MRTDLWNLCKDPANKNHSAPHCDRGGDGVRHRRGAVCAELSGAATQATAIWNFPAGSRGSLDLVFQLSRGFGGANISLSDFLAPAFDAKTDWASGPSASLAVLPILRGGRVAVGGSETRLPLEQWLRLRVSWVAGHSYSATIAAADRGGRQLWSGAFAMLKTALAMPPSYLRVRSLGPGGVCLRSANASVS